MSRPEWQPSAPLANLTRRAAIKATVRAWFAKQTVTEVDTSPLCAAPVSDVHITSVQAQLAAERQCRYLHTSPEYPMKRLLAAGAPDIYQMCTVFRDDESGARHQPDFTLIEWYRLGFGLREIEADTVALLNTVLAGLDGDVPVARRSYRDAFIAATGLDPITASCEQLTAASTADKSPTNLKRDALLDWFMVSTVIPTFSPCTLTIIDHYPASQAALARLCPADDALADRFEIFYGDIELANGYVELTDSKQQRQRFNADLRHRVAHGQPVYPLDEQFLAALEYGLPPCAGVAVGLDRLVMAAIGESDIRRVQSFPARP